MKFIDKSGITHKNPITAQANNLARALKLPPLFGHVDPDMIPYPDLDTESLFQGMQPGVVSDGEEVVIEAEDITPDGTCAKIAIDYDEGTVTAFDRQGNIISTEKIDERLLYGIARDAIDSTIKDAEFTDEDIDKVVIGALASCEDNLRSLAMAADGKNRLISAQFDDQFIDTAATVLTSAMRISPRTVRMGGKDFIKKILGRMEEKVNSILSPSTPAQENEGEEPEARG